jgi:hypothetical protein
MAMAEPIIVRQLPEEKNRTPNKSCYWRAEAIICGVTYAARSRYGAPNELARQLVAAGIADAPMTVYSGNLRGHMTIPSFHEAAKWTYTEGAFRGVRRTRWVDLAAKHAQPVTETGPKQGVKPSAGTGGPDDASGAVRPDGEAQDRCPIPDATPLQKMIAETIRRYGRQGWDIEAIAPRIDAWFPEASRSDKSAAQQYAAALALAEYDRLTDEARRAADV